MFRLLVYAYRVAMKVYTHLAEYMQQLLRIKYPTSNNSLQKKKMRFNVRFFLFLLQRRSHVVERARMASLAGVRRAAMGGRGAAPHAADDVPGARATGQVQHTRDDAAQLHLRGLQQLQRGPLPQL